MLRFASSALVSPAVRSAAGAIVVADHELHADPSGALFWSEEHALVVADLHLEKGSSFAARGVLLPPYDTAATLARLGRVIDHYQPRRVIALGDSFHDNGGPARIDPDNRVVLHALQCGRDWLWIAGNHDPDPPRDLGGDCAAMLALGPLVFRHEPSPCQAEGEIAGHLHPTARVAVRGRSIGRRCFAADHRRVVMPAFGAYAGGLNVRHQAFAGLFEKAFVAHLLGERRTYAFAGSACLAD